MSLKNQNFLKFLNILISIRCVQSALLYPQSTVIQLVASISVPIIDLPSDRKVSFDWGLQMNYDMPYNVSSFYMVPIWAATNGSRHLLFGSRLPHGHDFSVKQLYDGLENMFESYGYDKSCLKQSICELSQYQFDDAYANIVTAVVTFLLTPSIHQEFSEDERYEATSYILAENQGYMGRNCQQLYPQCINGLFSVLTKINFIKV